MKTAVKEIIEHFERANAERYEPYADTFVHPATGVEMENAVMIPVRLLRELVQQHTRNGNTTGELAASLAAWSPMIASGYEVPAASMVMNSAADRLVQQQALLETAYHIVHHFAYTGPYEGRPTDDAVRADGRAFIESARDCRTVKQ